MSKRRLVSIESRGYEELYGALREASNVEAIGSLAVFDATGIVADEMKKNLQSLKTTKDGHKGSDKSRRYCYQRDKEVLIEAMGISPFGRTDDAISAKVGFDGYFEMTNGETMAIPKLANCINAGTSFMYSQPFIRKTVSATREKVKKAMDARLEKEIKKSEKQ